MKIFLAILFIAAAGPAPAPAARADWAEDFIQGTWQARGTDPSGRHAWFQEWTFDHGKFKETGYPPLEQEGSYRVLKAQGNKITLELYDQKGTFGTENSQREIVINRRRGTLTFNNMVFRRAKPQS